MALNVLFPLALLVFSVHPLRPPQNVRVDSYNMGPAVLKWDAPGSHRDLKYTARYETFLRNAINQTMCQSIKEHWCDFGQLLNRHAIYKFSVRAERSGTTSEWKTCDFILDRDITIGPPTVTLVSKGLAEHPYIELNIQDPVLVLKKASLRNVYTDVVYMIRYWDEGHPKDFKTKNPVSEKVVNLRPLVPNTKYCIQVQLHIQDYNIMGKESNPICEMSSIVEDRKLVLSWVMVAVAVALPLLLLLSWSIYKARRFLNPKDPLPEHFTKQRPGVPPSLGLQAGGSEKYDQIWALVEEHPYHDIQDDSGSEEQLSMSDSGILEEMPKYYNGGVVDLVVDLVYENIPLGI